MRTALQMLSQHIHLPSTHLLIKDGAVEPIFLLNKVTRLGVVRALVTCISSLVNENGTTLNFHAGNLCPEWE